MKARKVYNNTPLNMQNTSGQCQKLTKLQTTNSVYTNCKMIIVSLVYIHAVGTILGVGTILC